MAGIEFHDLFEPAPREIGSPLAVQALAEGEEMPLVGSQASPAIAMKPLLELGQGPLVPLASSRTAEGFEIIAVWGLCPEASGPRDFDKGLVMAIEIEKGEGEIEAEFRGAGIGRDGLLRLLLGALWIPCHAEAFRRHRVEPGPSALRNFRALAEGGKRRRRGRLPVAALEGRGGPEHVEGGSIGRSLPALEPRHAELSREGKGFFSPAEIEEDTRLEPGNGGIAGGLGQRGLAVDEGLIVPAQVAQGPGLPESESGGIEAVVGHEAEGLGGKLAVSSEEVADAAHEKGVEIAAIDPGILGGEADSLFEVGDCGPALSELELRCAEECPAAGLRGIGLDALAQGLGRLGVESAGEIGSAEEKAPLRLVAPRAKIGAESVYRPAEFTQGLMAAPEVEQGLRGGFAPGHEGPEYRGGPTIIAGHARLEGLLEKSISLRCHASMIASSTPAAQGARHAMISIMVSPKRLMPSLSFILSLAALCLVIGLVWAMILEERRARSLSLQFDIYRASAALVEAWLDNPEGNLVGGPVLGFGVYNADGKSITAQGSAPPRLDRGARSFVLSESGPEGATIRLMRPMPAPGGPSRLQGMRGGMMRSGGGFGSADSGAKGFGPPMGGMMGPPGLGASPGSPLDLLFASPRTMWLEYAVPPRPLGETFLVAGGVLLSLVLVGIYLLVLVLMRRNGELKERESRNRELAELGQAARTLVHEIKNPLGVIGIQAATLRRREGENSLTGKAADVIDREVRRLAGMADRIREFLKAGPGDPHEIELLAFIRAFVERHDPEAVGGRAGIDLSLPTRDGGAMVRVDPDRLSLALDNLVANAREADPEGRISLEVIRKGRSWVVAVGDRGGGVDPESRARLFEPFFTTKEKGSGIGLALARSVARGSGGDLAYAPRPEGGSFFILSLPALV